MKNLVLDTESTTFKKGNPFARRNRCCAISYLVATDDGIKADCFPWEYNAPATADYLLVAEELLDDCELLIGFNLKYDLHVLRKAGIIKVYTDFRKKLWCCQVAQFIIRNQQERMPSLNSSCAFFGLGQKLDVVEKEYWDKGVDTPDIPWPVLSEYAISDVDLTYKLYLAQQKYLEDKPEVRRLIQLACQDLLILAEMEWNGLRFDTKESAVRAEKIEQELKEIDEVIKSVVGDFPFNFNSNDHCSVILYGGTIKFVESEVYDHVYKSGPKQGLTEPRYKHKRTFVTFPRLVEPKEGTQLAKVGYWSTDESALTQLKASGGAKTVIKAMLRRSELERLVQTYYRGFPKKIAEMDWPEDELHSNLNQSVVITGRLSSSGPNQQNIPPDVGELIRTRYV